MQRRDRLLGPAYRLFYDEPVHLVRGEGVTLYDAQGNAYLDAYNNVPVVGHCHPAVVQAMARQAAVLNTHTRYLHETVLDYAEALLDTFPAELGQVMFTCTGSESNDLALRLARNATGATGVIVTRHAYHGVTMATADLSPSLGAAYRQPDGVELVIAPNPYRHGVDTTALFVAQVKQAIERLAARGLKPAAILVDTILSSDGVLSDVSEALRQGVDCVRAAGGLFIADEVQAGFGRTGGQMWGFQRHELLPDIVTLGKPMGNGHPMAGVVAKPHLLETFGRTCRYFNTFGGNPVSSAVGLAVLRVIQEEGLVQHAREVGEVMNTALWELADRHALIGDVRGAGLFVGVELVTNRQDRAPAAAQTAHVVNRMRQKGVLISGAGPLGNVLKIRPPLPFSVNNAHQFIQALDETLGELD
ncbi:aminotransferase class III-fold pyridoxal phosphate-dependent enzyme [Allopusillimonas ginsengisoli]|nr:aminotransferase class III-fold pyridoxal phosphate-dependent enzyme [Allopusillimonas ginsengisoli]